MSLFLWSAGSNIRGKVEGIWRVLCQLKKPSKGHRPRWIKLLEGTEKNSLYSTIGHFFALLQANCWFFTYLARLIFDCLPGSRWRVHKLPNVSFLHNNFTEKLLVATPALCQPTTWWEDKLVPSWDLNRDENISLTQNTDCWGTQSEKLTSCHSKKMIGFAR